MSKLHLFLIGCTSCCLNRMDWKWTVNHSLSITTSPEDVFLKSSSDSHFWILLLCCLKLPGFVAQLCFLLFTLSAYFDVNILVIAVHSLLLNCILVHRLRPYVCYVPHSTRNIRRPVLLSSLPAYNAIQGKPQMGIPFEWKMETTKGLN